VTRPRPATDHRHIPPARAEGEAPLQALPHFYWTRHAVKRKL